MTLTADPHAPVSVTPGCARRTAALGDALRCWPCSLATAVLYLWGLGSSGWANDYYAAAAQAGTQDLKAWLFGSLDAGNAITVDKPPAALWVMALSGRLFGFNAFTMLLPQALMGVGAVALLYAAVRRVSGPGAGLIAGAALALTPVAALMFRFNNPDALLVLLLVAAAYCVVRAIETASTHWMALAGCAIGFAFLDQDASSISGGARTCAGLPGRRARRAVAADLEADGRRRRDDRFGAAGTWRWSACGLPTRGRTSAARPTTACAVGAGLQRASAHRSVAEGPGGGGHTPVRRPAAVPVTVPRAWATCSSAAIPVSAGCSACRWAPRRPGCCPPRSSAWSPVCG